MSKNFDALRDDFVVSTRRRLTRMNDLVVDLERDPSEALDEFYRHFHALSGLGATYGFPRVTELASPIESELQHIRGAGHGVDPARIARWRACIAEIERAITTEA